VLLVDGKVYLLHSQCNVWSVVLQVCTLCCWWMGRCICYTASVVM